MKWTTAPDRLTDSLRWPSTTGSRRRGGADEIGVILVDAAARQGDEASRGFTGRGYNLALIPTVVALGRRRARRQRESGQQIHREDNLVEEETNPEEV